MTNVGNSTSQELNGELKNGTERTDADGKERKAKSEGLLVLVAAVALASVACNQERTGGAQPSRIATTTQPDVLGTAANFRVLGASTVTNTGPTVITGDLGLSPGSAITGFPPGIVSGTTHAADGPAGQAQSDLNLGWTTLKNEACQFSLNNAELGGLTLTPGVYCFTSPSAGLTGALTLDAQGKADAVFVFQIASTLTTASNSSVIRINGGSDCNVFWEIGSSATLGTGTKFRGNILALASITATTGATISGRLLAHTGAVTLDNNTVRPCTDMAAIDAGADASRGAGGAAAGTGGAPGTGGSVSGTGGSVAGTGGSAMSTGGTGGNRATDAGRVNAADASHSDAGPCAACGTFCAASETCCNAGCIDLTSDPKNCGSCGNVCGPSDCCRSGSCQPL
jgi:hypothetical protein